MANRSVGKVPPNVSITSVGSEYYDCVCALSQKLINQGFEKLYSEVSDPSELTYDDGKTSGITMNGKVLTPAVGLWQERSATAMTLQIRFASGEINLPQKRKVDLKGWIFTIVASFDGEAPASVGTDFEKPVSLTAGDYSAHRLFATLTGQPWIALIFDRSYCPDDNGRLRTVDEWAKDRRNQNIAEVVKDFLTRWAEQHHQSEFFTLGLSLSYLPPLEGPTGTPGNPGPLGDPFNCLVFAHVAGSRNLPAAKQLAFSENLAQPADGSTPEILGILALDRRFFVEKLLLPELQQLCFATQLLFWYPKFYISDDGKGWIWPEAEYDRVSAGECPTHPDGSKYWPTVYPSDPKYRFETKDNAYQWNATFDAPGSDKDVFDFNPKSQHWRKWSIKTTASVTCTMLPEGKGFRLSGRSFVDHWDGRDHRGGTFEWRSRTLDEHNFHEVTTTWTLAVVPYVVQSPYGAVKLQVLGCDSNNVPADFKCDWINVYGHGAYEKYKTINSGAPKSLSRAVTYLKETLIRYDSNGHLKLGTPIINDFGDIVAPIVGIEPEKNRIKVRPRGP